MSEERGFEVVDRRRIQADDESEPAPPAEEQESAAEPVASPEATDPGQETVADPEPSTDAAPFEDPGEDAGPGLFGDAPGLSVAGILQMSLGLLNEIAWVKMGMVANPITGKMEKDLGEARKAIDALADMLKHVEADASPEERRELQRSLTDLRINFVQQANRPD